MSDVNLFPGMAEMLKSHLANPDTASGHNEFAEEREKAKGKRGRKPANGKTSKAPAAKRKARVAKPKKPTQKEIARERRADNLFNKHNLLGGDLFHDVHSNVARSSGPTFTATKKQDALKQLVASIPSEQQHLAKIDKDQLKDALRWFTPAKSVQPDAVKDGWKMVGMKSTLSHYQMLGVSYMRQREQSEEHPKGGILADAMGLGKTVMMLGMSARVPTPRTFLADTASQHLQRLSQEGEPDDPHSCDIFTRPAMGHGARCSCRARKLRYSNEIPCRQQNAGHASQCRRSHDEIWHRPHNICGRDEILS